MNATDNGHPLVLRDIARTFQLGHGRNKRQVRAVDGVSLRLEAGRTLAVVGESGSGKTTLARLALRLVPPTSGEVILEGRDITRLSDRELRPLRARAQMVFQDPMDSLAPWHTVEQTVGAALRLTPGMDAARKRERVIATLDRVGLSSRYLDRYPHELSGGQAQRVGIARAIITEPAVVVLDEPTSALDMSVQAQILALLHELQRERGLSYLFISHDLAVVRYIADRTAVMYGGRIVEEGSSEQIFESPREDYTQRLVAASPQIQATREKTPG